MVLFSFSDKTSVVKQRSTVSLLFQCPVPKTLFPYHETKSKIDILTCKGPYCAFLRVDHVNVNVNIVFVSSLRTPVSVSLL